MKTAVIAFCVAICAASTRLIAQNTAPKAERDSALALVNTGKSDLALPYLEKLAAAYPNDIEIQERLGLELLKTQGTLNDAEARRKQRIRARSLFANAVKLGSRSEQTKALLSAIPEDGGGDSSYSANADVEAAMQAGEKAFSSSDYRLAFVYYQKALALDSMQYHAALYSGDTYLHTPTPDSAFVWYARATRINPNKETAWRYWSDVLLKRDMIDEAREKAVQAIVAEPYNRISISALGGWANKAKVQSGLPPVTMPKAGVVGPGSSARAAYDSVRTAWKGTDEKGGAAFRAAHPSETNYRHSVAEERAALLAAYRSDTTYAGMIPVKKLSDAGVLDVFILIAAADDGIALEYGTYRLYYRDVIEKFWKEHVIGSPYSK